MAQSGLFFNSKGSLMKRHGSIYGILEERNYVIHMIGSPSDDENIPSMTPYLAAKLDDTVYFYTGTIISSKEIDTMIDNNKLLYERDFDNYGKEKHHYQAIQEALAWNMIYDPSKKRIITPVSRTWSVEWGGYVKHCWDMYFNALMYSSTSKELAYISAIEMTKEHTDEGFVPNCVAANGFVTLDRSQPPVGSIVVNEIYKKNIKKNGL